MLLCMRDFTLAGGWSLRLLTRAALVCGVSPAGVPAVAPRMEKSVGPPAAAALVSRQLAGQ
jgi:hypothetical protein